MQAESRPLSFAAGGAVSYTSLWNSSTDFHTHCETAAKLAEEKKKLEIGVKDVFLRGLFSLYLSAPFCFCLSSCILSICAPLSFQI